MTCVLTFDHRFIDGAPAARFLAAFAAACSARARCCDAAETPNLASADGGRHRRRQRNRPRGVRAAGPRRLSRRGRRSRPARAQAVANAIGGAAYEVDVADEASSRRCSRVPSTRLAAVGRAGHAGRRRRYDALFRHRRGDVSPCARHQCSGTFLCIREAAKRMRSGGRICTVASVAGKRGGGLSALPRTRQ